MKRLKVCFVGIGSIAKRHIRNLHLVCNERGIEVYADAFRRDKRPAEGIDKVYSDIAEVPFDYDAIFITNPTEYHLEALKLLHDKGKHFFIEKPVVSVHQIEEANRFQLRPDSVYYVASPLKYNAVVQWIRDNINKDDVISIRSISSSYLPDWRPGQDYRNTYSAHRNLGGGVAIDLIHEWDYLTYLFGWPKEVKSLIGKKSGLEIDSDDYAIYIAEYENMIAELHLDYFGRKTIREIQLFMKEDTIIGDIANSKVSYLQAGKSIFFDEERDVFQQKELQHFLDMIGGYAEKEQGYSNGIRVLELTQGRL